MTDQMTDQMDTDYTPAFRASCYLSSLTVVFSDGTRPELDAARCGADEFPVEFARLESQWDKCLNAAATINERYYEDWNRQGGVLTVIAPKVRECALSELKSVWNVVCDTYIAETLNRERRVWDCPFCGKPVDPEGWYSTDIDSDRCPECMCILWMNDQETDWCLP